MWIGADGGIDEPCDIWKYSYDDKNSGNGHI